MIGGAKGIGIGIDFGIPNQYCRATSKPYIEKDVLDSLRVVASAYGKTNEDSDRSIVKNLVDPDNPFVISNAAFKLNSGFGKYETELSNTRIWTQSKETTSSPFSSNYNGLSGWIVFANTELTNSADMPSFKIQVKGLLEGQELIYRYYDSNGQSNVYSMGKDGEYTLPADIRTAKPQTTNTSGFQVVKNDTNTITITQIPSFVGAFVTDGIDDLITSTKTVQEMLGGSTEFTAVSMIHLISPGQDVDGAAYTNYIRTSDNYWTSNRVSNVDKTGIYGYSFKQGTPTVIDNILGDKNDYTAEKADDVSEMFRAKFSIEGFEHVTNGAVHVSSVAWYWTIIANKVLTTDQINQVIAYFNLDRTLKPDILCDVKKQGITNDNHAEFGDKLIDFSGNGRDIQLNNLAWKGDSGIGKYEVDFLDSSIWNSSNSTITSSKIDCKNAISHIMLLYYSVGSKEYPDIPSFKVIKTGADIDYSYINETGSPKSVKIVDGVNVLPASHNTLYSGSGRFCGFGNPGMGNSVTITQIPSHAGALYLDGVSDFGKVTGMPIYKDYTFIIDRQIISIGDTAGVVASKSEDSTDVNKQGAFLFEYLSAPNNISAWSFYKDNGKVANTDFTRGISYQSTYSYNGKDLTVGTSKDSDKLWLGIVRDRDSRFFNGAIYSLMSFPYSMSEFLIERQLRKHKLGTLYPDMVEFRPIVKSNSEYQVVDFYIDTLPAVVGNYYPINSKLRIAITTKGAVDEVTSLKVNGIDFGTPSINNNRFTFNGTLSDKSPQKVDITIDEYIRYEDIVQPYPSLFTLIDYDTKETYSWGSKLKVGTKFTGKVINLLPDMYQWDGDVLYNGKTLNWGINPGIVAKEMIFSWSKPFKYLFDNNAPKCILSPSRLRIPNSSYKILGYIPDLSGNGNHGIINNSAYAEGSGVNADGSYQLDGVNDFITNTEVYGGKQIIMKCNWQSNVGSGILYDQRGHDMEFAIFNADSEGGVTNIFIAYSGRHDGKTYIDGVLNTYIHCRDLKDVTHNITITNELSRGTNTAPIRIGCSNVSKHFTKMALYDFMLFDEISTDDKIKELNEYVGIEAKVELPPYYWDAYGKTNLDGDKATIQQRGVAVGDYDLTNNNLAYEGMSGYNGYPVVFGKNKTWTTLRPESDKVSYGLISNRVTIYKTDNADALLYSYVYNNGVSKGYTIPAFKLKVTGLTTGQELDYRYISESNRTNSSSIKLDKDGTYNMPQSYPIEPNESTNNETWIGFLTNIAGDCNVTIEVLPEYPNGCCLDGVDDYLFNANIPVLTDYTYILKRELLANTVDTCSVFKGTNYTAGGWAFIADYYDSNGIARGYSFGNTVSYTTNEKTIYGTKTSVNGNTIVPGPNVDELGITLGKWSSAGYKKMVFYKLMLYPKTIPLLQINFLKNLMERDEIIDLNSPIFIKE